jgi:hypothetical protein
MQTIISRTWYCPICAALGQPKIRQKFVVYGSTNNEFKIRRACKNGIPGFTPHLLRLYQTKMNTHVIYDYACGICGITYGDGVDFPCRVTTWKRDIMLIKNWNDWVLYKWDLYYYI